LWAFLLETLYSIVNKFNFEWPMLLAKHVEKVIFLVYLHTFLLHQPPSGAKTCWST
jgi:hypothetical protein